MLSKYSMEIVDYSKRRKIFRICVPEQIMGYMKWILEEEGHNTQTNSREVQQGPATAAGNFHLYPAHQGC
jgi:hypothetical protein